MSDTAGAPPVERRMTVVEQVQEKYVAVQDALRRPDRRAEMLAMFDGREELLDRFVAVALQAIARDSSILRDCTQLSIIQSIKDAASLGLEPTGLGGDGALIPYKGQLTFQPMWRGILKRMRNSREIQDVDVQLVHENDFFEYELGSAPVVRHKPAMSDPGGYWGGYAIAWMPSGRIIAEVMTEAEINYIRDTFGNKVSRSGRPLPWVTSWGEMARKTLLKRLAKRMPANAVDQLILIDNRAEELAEQAETAPAQDVREAQRVALSAVGLRSEEPDLSEDVSESTEEPAEEPPPAVDTAEGQLPLDLPDESPFDPPINMDQPAGQIIHTAGVAGEADPNVVAAMRLNEEQQRLAEFRERSRNRR